MPFSGRLGIHLTLLVLMSLVRWLFASPGRAEPRAVEWQALLATALPERCSGRSICGLWFLSHVGALGIYASVDAGAEKGLLISEQQRALGAGLPYPTFASEWP